MDVVIRRATADDCNGILELIKELADYEKLVDRVHLDEKTLREDGFGEIPFYHCFVAETASQPQDDSSGKKLIGYCLYFYIYSTWIGRSVYMEDLYVQPAYRHQGFGIRLWKTLAQEAVQKKCQRLDFCVLDWNAPSISFYEKLGAVNQTKAEGWNVFRLNTESLKKLASS